MAALAYDHDSYAMLCVVVAKYEAKLYNQRMPLHMLNNIWNLILLFTAVLPLTDSLTRWVIILAFTLPLLTADWLAEQLFSHGLTQISTDQ